MRVFLEPTGLHSRAMTRVAKALERFAPPGVRVVRGDISARRADLVVHHLIDFPAEPLRGDHAILQYCLRSTSRPEVADWIPTWKAARLVWSYYDLSAALAGLGFCCGTGAGVNFLHAPLGVDEALAGAPLDPALQRDLVVTTGYVAGHPAEALEEVWEAARKVGLRPVHVGPRRPRGLRSHLSAPEAREGIPDKGLFGLLNRAAYVGALRYVEGFELGAGEGLARGARALVFDQPTTRRWYGGLPDYVQELEGRELVEALVEAMRKERPDTAETRRSETLRRFDWERIAGEFWAALLGGAAAAEAGS